MNAEHFWAAVALLALGGWAFSNAHLSRSLLPMANAVGALQKVDALIDDRIMRVVQRIREREEKRPATQVQQAQGGNNAAADALKDIFGGQPIEPISEQPDSGEGLEIVS